VTVAFTNLLTFNGDFREKPEVAGSQIWAVGVFTDLGDVMFCPRKTCMRVVEWAGALMQIRSSAFSVIPLILRITGPKTGLFSVTTVRTYEGGSKSFLPDIQKPRQMENAARDI
jgi:hypothetical protein